MCGSIFCSFIFAMLLLAFVLGLILHDFFAEPTIESALLLHFGADGALLDLAKVLLGAAFLGHDAAILRVGSAKVKQGDPIGGTCKACSRSPARCR